MRKGASKTIREKEGEKSRMKNRLLHRHERKKHISIAFVRITCYCFFSSMARKRGGEQYCLLAKKKMRNDSLENTEKKNLLGIGAYLFLYDFTESLCERNNISNFLVWLDYCLHIQIQHQHDRQVRDEHIQNEERKKMYRRSKTSALRQNTAVATESTQSQPNCFVHYSYGMT